MKKDRLEVYNSQFYAGNTFQQLLEIVDRTLERHAEIERVRSADVAARMDCRQSEF